MTLDDLSARARAESTDEAPASLVSFAALKATARRRRRFWLSTALIGLLLGSGMHYLVPAKYSAVSEVFLVEPAGSDPDRAMATDNSLLETTAVAAETLATLHLNMATQAFLKSYRGTVISDGVLSITLSAPTKADAIARNRALASVFLSFRADQYRGQNQVVVNDLNTQISTLEAQINQLSKSINVLSTSTATAKSANSISTLVSQRTDDASSVSQLQGQIQQDQLGVITITQGSTLLDPPAVDVKSVTKIMVTDALSGLVAGLGLGLAIVLLSELLSDRLRRRDDVATALGTPVELSIGRYRAPRVLRRPRLLRRVAQLGPQLHAIEIRLGTHLQEAPRSALAIVAIECSDPTALVVAALARSLIAEGKQVAIVDAAAGHPMTSLFGRTELGPITVTARPEDPTEILSKIVSNDVDATLVLATVDPAFGADHIAAWATDAVVILAAGKASGVRVSVAGQLLRRAGIAIKGAILIGADSTDESSGAVLSEEPLPVKPKRGALGSVLVAR